MSRIKAKYPNIERPSQKISIDNQTVIMGTFDSIYTYKSNWIKYIFMYNENIALSSSDLSGIIIPKRYLNETIKNEILKMYSNIEIIKIS